MKYFVMLILSFGVYWSLYAQNLEIIPEAQNPDAVVESVEKIGNAGWHVWDAYNEEAEKLQSQKDLWAQMASGIFTWDTILD